jgi:hypothetical protein
MEPYTVKSDEDLLVATMDALNSNPAATRPHLTARRTTLLQQPAFVTSAPSSHTEQHRRSYKDIIHACYRSECHSCRRLQHRKR